jgi:hypothetical protein
MIVLNVQVLSTLLDVILLLLSILFGLINKRLLWRQMHDKYVQYKMLECR